MANTITVAQILTLHSLIENRDAMEEIKIAHRYSSGMIVVYTPKVTIDIFVNGDWRQRSPQTGEKIKSGKFGEALTI